MAKIIKNIINYVKFINSELKFINSELDKIRDLGFGPKS